MCKQLELRISGRAIGTEAPSYPPLEQRCTWVYLASSSVPMLAPPSYRCSRPYLESSSSLAAAAAAQRRGDRLAMDQGSDPDSGSLFDFRVRKERRE